MSCTQRNSSKLPLITTYQDDFAHTLGQAPPLPFCQEPCLYRREDELNPRCFPISLPVFPHRKRESNIPIACGFETDVHAAFYADHKEDRKKKTGKGGDGNNDGSVSKNSTRPLSNATECASRASMVSVECASRASPASRASSSAKGRGEFEYQHSIPHVVLNELQKLHTYTPSSDLREITLAPNLPKREPCPQLPLKNTVRFRQQVKHAQPQDWQKVGVIWDKCQERNGFNSSTSQLESSKTENRDLKTENRLLSRPRKGQSNSSVSSQPSSISPPVQKPTDAFNSHIPGYGGYKPQLPIKHCADTNDVIHSTTSKTYYRTHPRISYRLPKYGHKGPMSRLVTLTEPFNPFNKIRIERVAVK